MRMKGFKNSILSVALFIFTQIGFPVMSTNVYGEQADSSNSYLVELSRWGIYHDGTHPVETTKGINEALVWANKNKITALKLPSGTYLIDKASYINMVSNMTFELTDDAILQKETNGKENYKVMYLGKGIDNVTLRGGTYRGDKDTHDYTMKDNPYSSGTHEAGHGILTEGASNITITDIKSVNFTGDGLMLGGYGSMVKDLYETSFVSGAMNDLGRPISDVKKIRTKVALDFKNPLFQDKRTFELSNFIHLPSWFELYFYKADGKLLKKIYTKERTEIQIPEGADSFHLVFSKPKSMKGVYLEFWNRVVSQNVTVQNSEFAFNRRQGITVGGANHVWIKDNNIHDMKGTAPQSGIDVEGGYEVNGWLNSNITILRNEFYNNAAYDVILFDGRDAVVEDNHLASKGAIGVAVSDPFTGARVINNHFDGSRIAAENDAVFINNKMNDSYTTFNGPNIAIDGMELTDSRFAVSAKVPFGVSVSNVTITNNKKSDSGLSIWGEPIRIKNMTIIGEPTLRSVTGGGAGGSIFDNLKVLNYNSTYGLSLPPGTYNNCEFQAADGERFGHVSANLAGKYVFNKCSFKSNATASTLLYAEHPNLELSIKDSNFDIVGNTQAISIQSAKSATILNNTITANFLTSKSIELIKVNDYWKRNDKYDVLKANISGNKITANIAAIGISTLYAGAGAPSYALKDNLLSKATLSLKSNDNASNNTVK